MRPLIWLVMEVTTGISAFLRACFQKTSLFLRPLEYAGGRQPLQLHRHQHDEQHAEPERRHGDADHRNGAEYVIRGFVALHRADEADGDADQDGYDYGDEDKLQRHGETLRQALAYLLAAEMRYAHVAAHKVGEPGPVLDVNGEV